ncbi:MAG: hypothetical protein KJ795_03150 [Gammaproteobacteria bacterium]|nr:hypothetical protein [Gammaproteobacteria bacterium]MBU1967766.1 hypothetical protein [Gammaproteobacteria bacterium]
MNQSSNEMSGFLSELASEATQKLEAKRTQQQDRQSINRNVNAALERTFKFFNLFANHLNAIEPDIPRVYALDGKAQFSSLKWKSGMAEFRKQSLADDALLDYVYLQVRLVVPESVVVTRRWELFNELKKDLEAFGLKTKEDMIDLWRNRTQKVTFQVNLEPEFIVWLRFRGNYSSGIVEMESNNLDGFGGIKGMFPPEALHTGILDEIGRFLMGRSTALPMEFRFVRD